MYLFGVKKTIYRHGKTKYEFFRNGFTQWNDYRNLEQEEITTLTSRKEHYLFGNTGVVERNIKQLGVGKVVTHYFVHVGF